MARVIKPSGAIVNISWFISFVEANVAGFFFTLLALFLHDMSLMPITVNRNEFFDFKLPFQQALAMNLGMCAVFGFTHSFMVG
jgi:hypothetical protein